MNKTLRRRLTRAGGAAALLLLATLAFAPQAMATYPGHNGLIAFTGLTGDHYQIYTLRSNGRDLRQLTSVVDGDAMYPDWSPDGRRIVFSISYADRCSIVIMNADGGDQVDLADSTNVCAWQPSFTPDGRRIVFDRYDGVANVEALTSMDVSGGDVREITTAGNTNPAVSPDWKLLSFIDETETGKSLWVAKIDGSDPRELLPPDFDIAVKHDWAPDGRHLLVGGNANGLNPNSGANIAAIRPDGSHLHYLSHYHDPAVHALNGTYSPDGSYIVFRLEDHDSAALMQMRSDGGHVKQIRGGFSTSGFKPRSIDWGPRPDRRQTMRRLALTLVVAGLLAGPITNASAAANGRITFGFGDAFIVNPDGTHLRQIGPPGSTACTSWSPDGGRMLCHSEGVLDPADAGLYTAQSADATDLVRVSTTIPAGYDIRYGYSPDGSRILFTQYEGNGHGTLYAAGRDGTDPIQLTPSALSVIDLDFYDQVDASWSPDGSRVTFAALNPVHGHLTPAIFVVNADGSGLRQIAPSGIGARSAQWSPTGDRIAFTSGCCGAPEAWVVRPDGAGLREVTSHDHRRWRTGADLVARQREASLQPERPRRPDQPLGGEHRRLGPDEAHRHRGPDRLPVGKRTG